MINPAVKHLNLKNPKILLASWMGFGFLTPAPGTWGSLAALPFGLIFFGTGGLGLLLGATIVIFYLGIHAAEALDKAMQSKDSSMIVVDEVAGQWIAMAPALYFYGMNAFWVFLSFALFRVFDIFKPWPVCFFDRKISGGLGVMADDIVAGLYAALCIIGLRYAGFG